MKKLLKSMDSLIKDTFKDFFSVMKYKPVLPLSIVLGFALFLYDENQLGKENYRLLPETESKILQKYDRGIKGHYSIEDMRKLLMNYDLVLRENPREIPKLKAVPDYIEESKDYPNENSSSLR